MKITTCLWFDGNARAAAEFYVSIFPGSRLSSNWIAPTDTPSNEINSEVVVEFEIFNQPFLALNGGPGFQFTPAISFQIPCANQDEIDQFWSVLTADGGEPGNCGWLVDNFGVSWQVVAPEMNQYLGGPNPDGAAAATEAMLKMSKIVLADMKSAYESAQAK